MQSYCSRIPLSATVFPMSVLPFLSTIFRNCMARFFTFASSGSTSLRNSCPKAVSCLSLPMACSVCRRGMVMVEPPELLMRCRPRNTAYENAEGLSPAEFLEGLPCHPRSPWHCKVGCVKAAQSAYLHKIAASPLTWASRGAQVLSGRVAPCVHSPVFSDVPADRSIRR